MSIGQPPSDPNISQSLSDYLVDLAKEFNKPKRPIHIPVNQFSGFYNTSGGVIQFAGIGNPLLQEINNLGIIGARFEAIGDSCHHLFRVPSDFNVGTNLKIELEWCTNSSTGSVLWRVRYSKSGIGQVLASATTVLDTAIVADNVEGSFFRSVTPYGLINADNLKNDDLVHFDIDLVNVTGFDPAVQQVFLLSILLNDEE